MHTIHTYTLTFTHTHINIHTYIHMYVHTNFFYFWYIFIQPHVKSEKGTNNKYMLLIYEMSTLLRRSNIINR